eukprot:527545_1
MTDIQLLILIFIMLILIYHDDLIKYFQKIISRKKLDKQEVIESDKMLLSRHHIIPKCILSEFWNNVVRNRHFNEVLLPFIECYASKNKKSLIRMNKYYPNNHYLWLPCNLFYGPTYRLDDPGAKFEINCHHITGITRNKARDFQKVFDLIKCYRKYRDPNIAKDAIGLFLKYKGNCVTPWNANNWVGPINGEYAIKKNQQHK